MWRTIRDLAIWFYTLPYNKRLRTIFYVIQFLLNLAFTAFLYKHFVGDYKIIDITNFKEFIQFFLSGQALLCLFLFFISWALFYNYGYYLVKWINKWLVRKIILTFKNWLNKKEFFNSEVETEENTSISAKYRFLEKSGVLQKNPENPNELMKGPNENLIKKGAKRLKELPSEGERYIFPYLLLALLTQFMFFYFPNFSSQAHFLVNLVVIVLFLFYLVSFFLTVFILEGFSTLGDFFLKNLEEFDSLEEKHDQTV